MINDTIPISIKGRLKEMNLKLQEGQLGAQVKRKILVLVTGRNSHHLARLATQVDMTQTVMFFLSQNISQAVDF